MQVRRIIGPSGVFCLTLAVAVPLAAEDIPREQHPWGRFAPGSWTRLKVTIDSLAEAGTKTARVEFVTTRLVKVDVHGVTLAVEIRRGKEVTVIPPQAKRWDGTSFDGERKQRLSLGEVKILGRSATCQTHEVTVVLGKTRTMTKSWYSPDVAPYFLKQLVRISGEMPRHTAMEVIKLNASRQVGSRKLVGWEARTTVADRTEAWWPPRATSATGKRPASGGGSSCSTRFTSNPSSPTSDSTGWHWRG